MKTRILVFPLVAMLAGCGGGGGGSSNGDSSPFQGTYAGTAAYYNDDTDSSATFTDVATGGTITASGRLSLTVDTAAAAGETGLPKDRITANIAPDETVNSARLAYQGGSGQTVTLPGTATLVTSGRTLVLDFRFGTESPYQRYVVTITPP